MRMKSQMSIFIVLGLFIGIISIFLITHLGEKSLSNLDGVGDADLNLNSAQIKDYVNNCLEDLALDSLTLYSIDYVETFIKTNIGQCENLGSIMSGMKFDYGEILVDSIISNDREILNLDISYPITFSNNNYGMTIKKYSFSIALKKEFKFNLDSNGNIINNIHMNLINGISSLTIESGTMPTLNGKLVDKINYKLITKNNQTAVYEFGPSGTIFDKPLILSISYDGLIFPNGLNESDLGIGVYNESLKKFVLLEDFKVNTTSKKIIGKINHFSKFNWGIIANGTKKELPVQYEFPNFNLAVNNVGSNLVDTDVISVSSEGQYMFWAYIGRGQMVGSPCQDKENFRIDINNVYYDLMDGDQEDKCDDYEQLSDVRLHPIGQFKLNSGTNSIKMTHLESSSAGAQSVYLQGLIANKLTEDETYYYINNKGLEIKFDYMGELPILPVDFTGGFLKIGSTEQPGFMSLYEYKEKLYAGTYNAGSVKVYNYLEWDEKQF